MLSEIAIVTQNMLVGDINADFTTNTPHTYTVRETKDELNLAKAWDSFPFDFTHTHMKETTPTTST